MDPEEIAKLVKNLKLSHGNLAAHVTLSPDLEWLGKKRLESCLVGRVFSPKAVNRDTFRSNMPRILQAIKAIDIEMVGENLFLFNFKAQSDKNRALYEGPWNFFKDLVLFAEPHGLQNPNDILFKEVPMWVQLHNLPLAFMQPEILKNLGGTLGKVIEVEGGDRGQCAGKFARIRIVKDLESPLVKGICVSLADSEEETCIILLYEKLPNFCFACGRLGHCVRDCVDNNVDKLNLQFGNWMRALPMVHSRRPSSSRGRNSDDSVPSGDGEATESPPTSTQDKQNTLVDDLQAASDEGNNEVVVIEKNLELSLIKDASSGNEVSNRGLEPSEHNTIIPFDATNFMEVVVHQDVAVGGAGKKIKSVREWKRHTRRLLPTSPGSSERSPFLDEGTRPRELSEKICSSSKKPKVSLGTSSFIASDSAVAAGQSRRTL